MKDEILILAAAINEICYYMGNIDAEDAEDEIPFCVMRLNDVKDNLIKLAEDLADE